MKEFMVVFSLRPGVKLDPVSDVDLKFEDQKGSKRILVSKIQETISGKEIQTGLCLRVSLQANGLKEAIHEAKSFADGIVSFITLTTGVGLDIPLENLAYEITPNVEEREFIQVFQNPFGVSVSRRKLDHQLLIQLIDRCMKLDPKIAQRISRAIRWYRMGTVAFDVFDRFNCFWIGLEALNPMLQTRLSVGDDTNTCPACGNKWVSTPTVSGLRAFVQTRIDNGEVLYRRFRRLRVDIMHGNQELEKVQKEASELSPGIAEVLFRAICFLLDMEDWKKVRYRSILEKIPMRIELDALLVGGEPDTLGLEGKDPFFEPTRTIFEPKISGDEITFEGKSSFIARLNSSVKWRPRAVRFYGDSEIKGSISNIETIQTSRKSASQD